MKYYNNLIFGDNLYKTYLIFKFEAYKEYSICISTLIVAAPASPCTPRPSSKCPFSTLKRGAVAPGKRQPLLATPCK